MLLYNLLNSGIYGKTHFTIKVLYDCTGACVTLNGTHTDWFPMNKGVRQGDNISPLLFSIFINQLSVHVKNLDTGISEGNEKVSL